MSKKQELERRQALAEYNKAREEINAWAKAQLDQLEAFRADVLAEQDRRLKEALENYKQKKGAW